MKYLNISSIWPYKDTTHNLLLRSTGVFCLYSLCKMSSYQKVTWSRKNKDERENFFTFSRYHGRPQLIPLSKKVPNRWPDKKIRSSTLTTSIFDFSWMLTNTLYTNTSKNGIIEIGLFNLLKERGLFPYIWIIKYKFEFFFGEHAHL